MIFVKSEHKITRAVLDPALEQDLGPATVMAPDPALIFS